ncbi:MAG: hypothetical protein UX91_C0007G0005 [Candidatus Amesbacteria bacterium GW2011_GWB1_47_19]|nr:MAG: hypothetical protein UW51_C0006G0175 [Candidatus Amesbacteria bacterium GW2011_GWA1_44_24]KKU31789.1 MAG: hypothetical protein UX46_C0002G0005 [Candidatus Amesbacteria bacterium GW2011_GWC1_46_24]KKU66725.1 MAG: hypothetical protein UX91_C0007G0005 [Candidatus Amesbacteria bacterium GW2011_GWB1_47_19]HBC73090.1 hypothetical protein [Candidatus Amesbacteria bacterium]
MFEVNSLFSLPAYHMAVINLLMIVAFILGLTVYRFYFPQKKINFLVLVIVLSFLPMVSHFRKGDYNSGLVQNASFASGFFSSLTDGNLVPRWAERLDTHFGYPAFIFMYHTPFYMTSFMHIFGFNFVNSVKLVFIFSYVLSGITFYLWARKKFTSLGSLLSTILYQFAPYRFINIYFRLDIGESVAFIFIPLVFMYIDQLSKRFSVKSMALGAISLWLLIISHHAVALATVILACVYVLYLSWKKSLKVKVQNFSVIIIGLLLSSYYWFPIIVESKYVHIRDFTQEIAFPTLQELIFPPYRFGLLFQGHNGEIVLPIGYAGWMVFGIGLIVVIKKNLVQKYHPQTTYWLIAFTITLFMLTKYSSFLWNVLPLIGKFQFSWRLLSIMALITATLAGIIFDSTKSSKNKYLLLISTLTIAVLSTILNWGNRSSNPKIISDAQLEQVLPIQSRIDYSGFPQAVPIWVNSEDRWGDLNVPTPINILSGKADYSTIFRNSTLHEYNLNAQTPILVQENTYYYPGWKLWVDNNISSIKYTDTTDPGVMEFDINPGYHSIRLKFTNTPDRTISLVISIVTGTLVLIVLFKQSRNTLNPTKLKIGVSTNST